MNGVYDETSLAGWRLIPEEYRRKGLLCRYLD